MLSAPAIAFAAALLFPSAVLGADLDVSICDGKGDEDAGKKPQFYSASGNAWQIVNNLWGSKAGGNQCTNVYDKGRRFDVLWKFDDSANDVNSYPHVKYEQGLLPVALKDVDKLEFNAQWGLAAGDQRGQDSIFGSFDDKALGPLDVHANVALDMFLDSDKSKAADETKAKFEIMIWFGRFGQPTYPSPLGGDNPPRNETFNGVTYLLYQGINEKRGITAYTWIPDRNMTNISGDFAPLMQFLIKNTNISPDLQLGVIEFGQETYRSTDDVTFAVKDFSIKLNGKEPKSGSGSSSGSGDKKDAAVPVHASRSAAVVLAAAWLLLW